MRDGGNQVGQGFPGTCPGLDQQVLPVSDRVDDGPGHGHLAVTSDPSQGLDRDVEEPDDAVGIRFA
jgi:hypothetical protein